MRHKTESQGPFGALKDGLNKVPPPPPQPIPKRVTGRMIRDDLSTLRPLPRESVRLKLKMVDQDAGFWRSSALVATEFIGKSPCYREGLLLLTSDMEVIYGYSHK